MGKVCIYTVNNLKTMKTKIQYKGQQIEVEGNIGEILQFIQQLFSDAKPASTIKTQGQRRLELEHVTIAMPKIPKVDEVISFIVGKGGNSKHTFGEIQQHFLGRVYHSKDRSERLIFESMYNRVSLARKEIEKRYGVTWQYEIKPTRESLLVRKKNRSMMADVCMK